MYRNSTTSAAPFRTFWYGVGVILLAAVLNLGVVLLVAHAPGVIPAKVVLDYEERKPELTFAVVAIGLVLVLRDVLAPLAARAPVPVPEGTGEFALIPQNGGVPLVTSQYVRSKGKPKP